MDDGITSHAMTEIALALAMAFFCILVLALVSMGTPSQESASVSGNHALAWTADTVPLSASGPETERQSLSPDDQLLVLRGRALLRVVDGKEGAEIQASSLAAEARVMIAVDPVTPLSDILAARERLAGFEVVLTALPPQRLASHRQ